MCALVGEGVTTCSLQRAGQAAHPPTLADRVKAYVNKLRTQGQQAHWYAISLESHVIGDVSKRMSSHASHAEALYRSLLQAELDEATLSPHFAAGDRLFTEWDQLLPVARGMTGKAKKKGC